ncbi:MAG: HAMP domain-containing sensor histidine kinase [Anaerolineales bacterium]
MPEPAEQPWRPTPRARPPWWPEDEPWPPQRGNWGRARWRGGPPFIARRYMLRAGLSVIALLVLTFGGCTLIFWLSASALGIVDLPGGLAAVSRAASLAAMVMGVLALVMMARIFRRLTAPVSEFMDAVERVAEGDYAARVTEQGPRDGRALARAFNGMVARLQSSETERRGLLADVTHELRTPLTVIQGNLEALLDGVYPADTEHLAPILDETQVLSRLIDDLRTLALAESGSLTLYREPTDLGVLAGETAAALRAQAEAAGVALTVDVSDDLPLLNVDPVRLREVLSNLTANALRYTPAGGWVKISGRTAEGEPPGVVLEVADSGAGISPEALPHIFDRFYKSAESRGTGLGLAIARNLVAAHGGEISVRSELGKGTVMTVRLSQDG